MLKHMYVVLDIPWVYTLSQWILAPGKKAKMASIFDRWYDREAQSVLDVACGPSPIGPLPKKELTAIDISEDYLVAYRSAVLRNGSPLKLQTVCTSAHQIPFPDGSFDEIRANGFLHHMDDPLALQVVAEMKRCLKPNGKLVVIEDIYPKNAFFRPIAWLIRKADRGRYMRTEGELIDILQAGAGYFLHCSRHTYTYLGTEYLVVIWGK